MIKKMVKLKKTFYSLIYFKKEINEINSLNFSKKINDLELKISTYLNLSSFRKDRESIYLIEEDNMLLPTAIYLRDQSILINPLYNYIDSLKEVITYKIEDYKKSLNDYKKFNYFSTNVYKTSLKSLMDFELDFKKDCKKLSKLKYSIDTMEQSKYFPLK